MNVGPFVTAIQNNTHHKNKRGLGAFENNRKIKECFFYTLGIEVMEEFPY